LHRHPKRAVSDWHGDSEPDDGPARREATDPRRGRSWALLDSRDRVRGRLCGRGEGRRAHERGAGDRREEHQVVDRTANPKPVTAPRQAQ